MLRLAYAAAAGMCYVSWGGGGAALQDGALDCGEALGLQVHRHISVFPPHTPGSTIGTKAGILRRGKVEIIKHGSWRSHDCRSLNKDQR